MANVLNISEEEPYVCEVDELVHTKDTMDWVCAWGPMCSYPTHVPDGHVVTDVY